MLMFIRLSFDVYKPNLEGMLVLLQCEDAELDRIVKWKKIEKKPAKNIINVIFFLWNCSSLGYKTRPKLMKWETT